MKALIVFIILLGISYLVDFNQNTTVEDKSETKIQVNVEGAVKQEGVYEIENGRMEDLFAKLTLTEEANCDCINMERPLYHEDIVYIPSNLVSLISLNHATKEELMTIKGIGPSRADKIIEYRHQNPFMSIEDIMNIKGIGYKTYLKWRPYLCL